MARIIGTAGSAPAAKPQPKPRVTVQPNPDQRVPVKPAPHPPVKRAVPPVRVTPHLDTPRPSRRVAGPPVPVYVPPASLSSRPAQQAATQARQEAAFDRFTAVSRGQNAALQAQQQRHEAALARVPSPFTPHPVAGMLGAEHRAIQSLAALHASNPAAYDARVRAAARHGGGGHLLASIQPGALGSAVAHLGASYVHDLANVDSGGSMPIFSGLAHVAGRGVKDLGSLAVGPFVGGYELGAAAVDAATGHPGRAAHRVVGLAKGAAQPFIEEATHPVKYLSQHPLLAVLNVAGAESALGRTEGAVSRGLGSRTARGVRGALDERSHVVRPPVSMTNDAGQPALVSRTFSKDMNRRAVQVSMDRRREPLRDAHGNVVTVMDRGREVPVLKSSPAEQERFAKQRADFHASRANMGERRARDQATKDSKVRGVRGKAAKEIVAMVAEGTITSARHFESDLRSHRDKLAARIQAAQSGAEPYRHAGDMEAAQNRLALVDRVLSSPRAMAQAQRIVAEGERHGAQLHAGDVENAGAGLGNPAALKRSALSVTALEHMGARHFTVEEHQALERTAAQDERAAAQRYEQATTPQARQQAAQDLLAARDHRIAVSGREPVAVRAHEDANARLSVAQAAADSARQAEKAQRSKIERMVTQHRSERGREAHHGPVAAYHIGGKGHVSAATVDVAYNNGFGVKRVMQPGARLDNVRSLHIPPGRDRGVKGTHRMSDAQVTALDRKLQAAGLHRVDNPDGSITWRRPASTGRAPQRFTLRQDAVAYAKAHGIPLRDIQRVATTAGEARRVGEISNARRALASIRSRRQAAEKAVTRAQRDVKANPMPPTRAALRYGEHNPFGHPAGAYLPNSDIEAFLRSRGRDPETVAYLPHRQDIVGARAHHAQVRPGQRPVLDNGETRTGEAYLKGVTEASQRLLHDQGVRQKVLLNKATALDRLVADHGLRHPAWEKARRGDPLTAGEQRIVNRGGLFTAREAVEFADRLNHDTGQQLTPMRAYNSTLSADTKRLIREDFQGPGGMETLPQHLLNDRIVRPGDSVDDRARNVVLVPTALVNRLEEHLRPAGHIEKAFQWLNRPFRMAVLPQPRWLTGNFLEAQVVRLGVKGSGVVNVFGLGADLLAARRALAALDRGTPEMRAAAAEIRAQQTGAGLFIGGRGASVHRTAEEVLPQSAQRAYGHVVSKLPVVGQMTEMIRSAAHWIAAPLNVYFEANRRGIEAPAQRAAFGHQFREDVQALTGSWVRSITLSKAAVDDAARGLVNTPAQQRFMHAQYELLGKYSGFSPRTRAIVQSVAPFLPWALNAARFVFWTMPAHHSALTALLVQTNQAVQKDWQQIHSDTPPGDLRDAIPNGHGGWIDLARYTPYGLTEPVVRGDVSGLTGFAAPQLQGPQEALAGRDPFGNDLRVPPSAGNPQGKPTTGQRVGIAANELAEAMVPYLAQGRRLLEHGETAYANSTILSPKTKPGTSHGMSAVRRTFDPLRPTYLRSSGEQVIQPRITSASKRRPDSGSTSTDPWDHVQSQPQAQTQAASPWDLVK